jgi:DNA-binding NarL/FixJ family response regulator
MIRVCLIGGIRLTREGVGALMRHDDGLEVTAHVGPSDGIHLAGCLADVAVVDASSTAPQAMRHVVEEVGIPTVALVPPDDEATVIALAQMGVMGFIEGDACLDELTAAIHSAARNEAALPPRAGTALLNHVSSPGSDPALDGIAALTLREREVIQLVAAGLSNKEIGAWLSIELGTVKNHVHNILKKLQVNGRSEAVTRLGISNGRGEPSRDLDLPRSFS